MSAVKLCVLVCNRLLMSEGVSLPHSITTTASAPEALGRHQWVRRSCETRGGGYTALTHTNRKVTGKQVTSKQLFSHHLVFCSSENIYCISFLSPHSFLKTKHSSLFSWAELASGESPHICRVSGYRLPAMTKPAIMKGLQHYSGAPPDKQL